MKISNKKIFEVLKLPEVRVSSTSYIRVQDKDGKYALLINENSAKVGKIVLTPIGGAIDTTSGGVESLKELLNI